MSRTLSLALPLRPAKPLWLLLAAELSFFLLLRSTDLLPQAAVRFLQLFLRF